jgi:hypothetical protein
MLSFETILVNILLHVESPLEFNFDVSMATKSPSHWPRVDIFQFWLVFFETPHAIGSQSLVASAVHALLNNFEFYLLMFSSYMLSVMNIDIKF